MRVIKDLAMVEPLVDVVEPKQVCGWVCCLWGGGRRSVRMC
jgi:hypothetical protein